MRCAMSLISNETPLILSLCLVDKTIETINRGIKELPLFDLTLRIIDRSNPDGKVLLFTRPLLPIRGKVFLGCRRFGVDSRSKWRANAFDCRRCFGRNPKRSLACSLGVAAQVGVEFFECHVGMVFRVNGIAEPVRLKAKLPAAEMHAPVLILI